MKNQQRSGRILGLFMIAALGLAPASYALDDPQTAAADKPKAEKPAKKRHQRFEAEDAATIKQRLEAYNKRAKADDRVHCNEEAVIGSNFKVQRCVTEEMREKERAFARNSIHNLRRAALRR